ncbi:MAG: trypsin-like peptidase domain-containing protein [Candidatus Hydrogenedentes bacterium]|nr:trypsin-like peptidase domain-containing protein [Candidatus Hydrogenedentota bacterium]
MVATRVLAICLAVMALLSFGSAAAEQGKEIYGQDDRIEVFEESDPFVRSLAAAVCVLADADELHQNGNGTFTLLHKPNVLEGNNGEELPLCADEAFSDQPYLGFCTGFLIAEDLIATAGHCLEGTDPSTIRIVFGWEMQNTTTPVSTVDAENVYSVEEVVEEVLNFAQDHSVLRLDRPVTLAGVTPLEVRLSGRVPDAARVGIIGHPMGLPKKIAYGPSTRVGGNLRPYVFFANFDASGGNSGSPVFNQETGVVEGIYVFSQVDDFIVDGDCFRLNRVDDGVAGQGVARSTNFAHLLPEGPVDPKLLPACGLDTTNGHSGSVGDVFLAAACVGALGWRCCRPRAEPAAQR